MVAARGQQVRSPAALRTIREERIKAGLCRTTINARINRIRRVFHGESRSS